MIALPTNTVLSRHFCHPQPAVQAVAGAVLHAPLVDLVGAMSCPDAPLTQHEYAEWGDPSRPEELAAMQATCPLTNIRPARCSGFNACALQWLLLCTRKNLVQRSNLHI